MTCKSNFCEVFINVCTAPASGPYNGAVSFQQSFRPCNYFGRQAQITSASLARIALLSCRMSRLMLVLQLYRQSDTNCAVLPIFPERTAVCRLVQALREAVSGLRLAWDPCQGAPKSPCSNIFSIELELQIAWLTCFAAWIACESGIFWGTSVLPAC